MLLIPTHPKVYQNTGTPCIDYDARVQQPAIEGISARTASQVLKKWIDTPHEPLPEILLQSQISKGHDGTVQSGGVEGC